MSTVGFSSSATWRPASVDETWGTNQMQPNDPAFSLQPGESLYVRIPPHAHVHVQQLGDTWSPHELQVAVTDGSGLYRALPFRAGNQPSLQLVAPGNRRSSVLRLMRPHHYVDSRRFLLHLRTSDQPPQRWQPVGDSVDEVHQATVRQPRRKLKDRRWFLPPNHPIRFDVPSDKPIELSSMLLYPDSASTARQSYSLAVNHHGRRERRFDYLTQPRYPMTLLDDVPALVGQPRSDVLQTGQSQVLFQPDSRTPATSQITLQSSAPILLRLRAPTSQKFLLPALNQANDRVPDPYLNLPTDPVAPDIWQVGPAPANMILLAEPEVRQRAVRAAKDSSFPNGGLVAACYATALADLSPHRDDAFRFADGLYAHHTLYRETFPLNHTGNVASVEIVTRHLRPTNKLPDVLTDVSQLLSDKIDQLPKATLFEVPLPSAPEEPPSPLQYRFPAAPSATWIRMVLVPPDGATNTVYWVVEGENMEPIGLEWRPPDEDPAQPQTEWRPGIPRDPWGDLERLAGGDASDNRRMWQGRSRITVSASVAEWKIPASCHWINVWQVLPENTETQPDEPWGLAVSYRTTRIYSLSDEQFWVYAQDVEKDQPLFSFFRAHHRDANLPMSATYAEHELYHHWAPLRRFLRSQYEGFARGLTKHRPGFAVGDPFTPQHVQSLKEELNVWMRDESWLPAFEILTELIRGAPKEESDHARLLRAQLLRRMGEHYLGDRQLRWMALQDPSDTVRQKAMQVLLAEYRRQDKHRSLVRAMATDVYQNPTIDGLAVLSTELGHAGKHLLALMCGQISSPDQMPVEPILAASINQRAWTTFELAKNQMGDSQKVAAWEGRRALSEQRWEQARDWFMRAGNLGRTWLSSMDEARAVERQLADPTASGAAIKAWHQWEQNVPGPRLWLDETPQVSACAGTRELVHPPRRITSRMVLATPELPVVFSLIGPATVELECRPVMEGADRMNGWIELQTEQELHPIAVINNRASTDLEITGTDRKPGQAIRYPLQVGPGLHRYKLHFQSGELLARVRVKRPVWSTGRLPWVSPDNLAAVLEVMRTKDSPISEGNAEQHTSSAEHIRGDDTSPSLHSFHRFQRRRQRCLATWPKVLDHNLSKAQKEACNLAAGDSDALLSQAPETSHSGLRRRLTSLLWLAQHEVERRKAALVEANALIHTHRSIASIQQVARRVMSMGSWNYLHAASSSMGLRKVATKRTDVDAPFLRIRQQLHAISDADAYLVGPGETSLQLDLPRPETLRLRFVPDRPDCAPIVDTRILVRKNDEPATQLVVPSCGRSADLTLQLPTGEHRLSMLNEDGYVNDFVAIQALTSAGTPRTNALTWARRHKTFQLASEKLPVLQHLVGPASLRVHERRGARNLVSEFHVSENEDRLVLLSPPAGEKSGLFRLYLRSAVTASRPPPLRPLDTVNRSPVQKLSGFFDEADRIQPSSNRATVLDVFDPGTWTLAGSAVDRRGVLEEGGSRIRNKYLETLIAGRVHTLSEKVYGKGELRVRVHEKGGPTWWASAFSQMRLPMNSTHAQLGLRGVWQDPNGNDFDLPGKLESSLSARLGLFRLFHLTRNTHHTTSIRAFGRSLSLNSKSAPIDRVDRDVFTEYKKDHAYGIRLSDQVTWRPYRDTRWQAGASLVTNERLLEDPVDQVSAWADWRQLFGFYRAGVRYRLFHYLDDQDRAKALTQHTLQFDLAREWWWSEHQRLDAGIRWLHVLDDNHDSIFITLSIDDHNGNRLRDYRQSEQPFFDLRTELSQEPHGENEY